MTLCVTASGREASGLSTDEVAQAQGILQVPLNPDFSSLNLAQAVLLVAYEWYQAGHTAVSSQAAPAASAPASQAAFDGFMVRLIQQLEDTRFLALPDKRPSVERKLRTLFAKANLSEAELGMLHGMIKALAEDGHKTR